MSEPETEPEPIEPVSTEPLPVVEPAPIEPVPVEPAAPLEPIPVDLPLVLPVELDSVRFDFFIFFLAWREVVVVPCVSEFVPMPALAEVSPEVPAEPIPPVAAVPPAVSAEPAELPVVEPIPASEPEVEPMPEVESEPFMPEPEESAAPEDPDVEPVAEEPLMPVLAKAGEARRAQSPKTKVCFFIIVSLFRVFWTRALPAAMRVPPTRETRETAANMENWLKNADTKKAGATSR